MATAIARSKAVIANAGEIGGRGKPSAMMAKEINQSGKRLARVALHELIVSIHLTFSKTGG